MRVIFVLFGSFAVTEIGDYSFFENFSTKEDWMNFTTQLSLWSAGNLYVSLDTFLLV